MAQAENIAKVENPIEPIQFVLEEMQLTLSFKSWNKTTIPSAGSMAYGDSRIWPEFRFLLTDAQKMKILPHIKELLNNTNYVADGNIRGPFTYIPTSIKG